MFTPPVRVYLLVVGLYYCVIAGTHLAERQGWTQLALLSTATAAAGFSLAFAWRLRRPVSLPLLEAAALGANLLTLANVVVDQLLSFAEHQLVYHLLMAVAFAAIGPTRRVSYTSVAVTLAWMVGFAQQASPDMRINAPFVALAAAFVALGMFAVIRGVLLRELEARLAAEELARHLQAELARNEELARTAQALALSEQVANRTKSEFLAMITHELRTPLNGVLGMAQVMALDELSGAQRDRLSTIQASGRALLATINDVLDISKIEAGRLELSPTVFHLGRFAEDLERLHRGLAAEKGLALSFQVEPGARDWRQGDEVRLRQVASNLIANALKFTEEGSVSVFIRGDAEGVRVSVADTGVGVPPERAPFLFEKFVQADASTTRRFGGTGLGLAICKEIVGLMGGDIDFTSKLGEGSCFTFQIPLPRTAAPDAGVGDSAALDRIRVLVVDDNPVNRTVAQTMLSEFGIACEGAESGEAAIAAWARATFDLILMDIHMPGLDGLAAAKVIRARERAEGRKRTPIIALTASAAGADAAAYLAAGMDEFVSKPIELARLMAAMTSVLDPPQPASEAATA